MKNRGPYFTLLTGLVLAAVLLTLSTTAVKKSAAEPQAGPYAATSPSPSPAASPSASTPTGPAQATYATHVNGRGATIAIAVHGATAVAYLCDGRRVEAWLTGAAVGGRLTMTGPTGATLTATYGQVASGQVLAGGRTWNFTAPIVRAPSGLYRAASKVRAAVVVGGWIVLPDGTQVGIVTRDAVPAAAPRLDVASGRAVVDGTTVTARPVDGSGL